MAQTRTAGSFSLISANFRLLLYSVTFLAGHGEIRPARG